LLIALATILIAAGVDLEANWNRLKALPVAERKKLQDNLLRFDAVLTPAQREGVRELDRKIHELPPAQQAEYFSTLRRFHTWLAHLPDDRREEILRAAPGERMAVITKVAALPRCNVPPEATPPLVQVAEIGEHSPFELAAIYKIWQALSPAQRKEVEKPVNNLGRLQMLFRLGDTKKLPHQIVPEDFDEEYALAELATFLKRGHGGLVAEAPKKNEARVTEIARRQAINLYYLTALKRGAIKRVSSERLEQFVATFPWWLQSTFESYPPDEARRRLTIVYRLVFPHPSEIKLAPRQPSTPAGSRTDPSPARKKAEPPGAPPATKSDAPL
jgi:hypothetical protein